MTKRRQINWVWGRERFKLKEREKNERKVINWVSGTCEGGSKRDSSGKKEERKIEERIREK